MQNQFSKMNFGFSEIHFKKLEIKFAKLLEMHFFKIRLALVLKGCFTSHIDVKAIYNLNSKFNADFESALRFLFGLLFLIKCDFSNFGEKIEFFGIYKFSWFLIFY